MNSSHSSDPWLGNFVGDNKRYRLDEKLGRGGMGEVFIAMDTRVGQQVALKLLKDTLVNSSEMRKRFEREIAVCAALQSEHIVKIMDCGFTSEGYPFYVMEYLRGETLRNVMLREKRLSVDRVQVIISQVCKGLQLAHEGVTLQQEGGTKIKVIHRDLKPDNIFLVPTHLGEWVKILDFGLAKVRNQSVEQTNLTKTFVGTFRYAAPEQLQNDENLDQRSDIYSLGLLIYEMLCGVDAFGLTAKSNTVSETSWVLAHTHEQPLPLRSSLLQADGEHISPQLEAVVMKCLRKKPEERFLTVDELNQALQIAVQSPRGNISSAEMPNTSIIEVLQNQGSNDETVSRTIQSREQSNADNHNYQSQYMQNEGSNDETINRPIKPIEQGSPGEVPLSNETQFQPRHQSSPGTPPLSNETQFQPRHQSSPTPPLSNETQFQPRHQQNSPEDVSNEVPNTVIEQPIEPPVESKQKIKFIVTSTQENPIKLWQIIVAIIAVVVAFFIGMNLNPQPSPPKNRNDQLSTTDI